MQYRPYSLSARTYTLWLSGLVGVIVCVVAVVFLLARVLVAANSINDKAADIRSSAAPSTRARRRCCS